MEDKLNEGNDTLENVETVKVGEHEVKMITKDGKTTIEAPEGLENDKDFQKKTKEVLSMAANINQKGFINNQRAQELDKREARLLALEEKAKVKTKTLTEEIMEELGANDEAELDEFTSAQRYNAQEKIEARRRKLSNETRILDTFSANGGDTADLKRFAKSLKAPISQALVNQYNNTIEAKPTFTSTNLAKTQGQSITFVKKGAITAEGNKSPGKKILAAYKQGHRF